MRSTEARVFVTPTETGRYLPEGPRVATLSGREYLVWVNIQTGPDATTGQILLQDLNDPEEGDLLNCPARPGFVLPVAGGDRLLIGAGHGLRVYAENGGFTPPKAAIPDNSPRTLINDAEIVPGGKAVVFGTKDTQFKEPVAGLYLFTVDDNRVTLLAGKQTCSNGKVIRKQGGMFTLYDIDTPTRKVVRYRLDVAGRTAISEGVAVDLAGQPGFPDGMRDCGDGTAVIALYNPDYAAAGKAVRFDLATGKAVEEWTTPGSPRVTCPLLVKRPDGVKLILTTATEGMPAEMRAKCPNAGCLFIADTQLASCPEPEGVRLP